MDCPNQWKNRRPFAALGAVALAGVLSVPMHAAAATWSGGPAVAVRYFDGSGPNSQMGKGLADMLVTDLVALTNNAGAPYKDCNMAVVEWEKRGEVQKELDLQKSPYVDPATRVEKNWIDPQYFVEGNVATDANAIAWSLQVRDARTGSIVATDDGMAAGDDVLKSSEGIARRLIQKLCRKGKDYSGRPIAGPAPAAPPPAPSPPPPAAKPAADKSPVEDAVNALKGLKGLFGK